MIILQTFAALRNAFQDELVSGSDKEVVLITLKRPLIYIQPIAVDKAILVWLNYKNAYEYWNEKRLNLNKEVLTATQQVFEKVPFIDFLYNTSSRENCIPIFKLYQSLHSDCVTIVHFEYNLSRYTYCLKT